MLFVRTFPPSVCTRQLWDSHGKQVQGPAEVSSNCGNPCLAAPVAMFYAVRLSG